MAAKKKTITVNKALLVNALMAVEKSLAWQDLVLSRLCLELNLVRQEVQELMLDPEMLKAKSELIDLLFPDEDFTPLLTDTCHDAWVKEFEQRPSPYSTLLHDKP